MKEKWKQVLGYEGKYEVSNLGRVRSITRKLDISHYTNRGGRRGVIGRMLAQTKQPNGYFTVSFSGVCQAVHKLVLNAFVGPRPIGMVCRHFPDRDKSNNRLDNLQWGAFSQNQKDRIAHGTNYGPFKERVLSPKQERQLKREYGKISKYGRGRITQRELAAKYKVSLTVVNKTIHLCQS